MTYMTGRAMVKAAAEVVRKVKSHAADILECDVSDLELRPDGRVGIIGVPQKEIDVSRCVIARPLGRRWSDHRQRQLCLR